MARIKRQIKRKAVTDGVIVEPSKRPPRFEWLWALGDQCGSVRANTRSEARSLIKTVLGLRKTDRLPVNIDIVKSTTTNQVQEYAP